MASTSVARIHELPNEALLSIFSFLPVVDLAHCAEVCGRWHKIVRRFAHLWKGKSYVSDKRPGDSAVTEAVLHALPPLEEVYIEEADEFLVDVYYPHLLLKVMDMRGLLQCLRLKCKCLSASHDVVRDLLSSRNTIRVEELQKLHILRGLTPNVWALPGYSVECVVRSALERYPNLRELSVCADSLSADHLDSLEGISRLQSLKIDCPCLEKLTFLRHCSRVLEELLLTGCAALPSQEYPKLGQLGNLRRLILRNCRILEGDLAAAVSLLASLEVLEVTHCGLIQDLSILWHCSQLRELRISNAYFLDALLTVTAEGGWLWLRQRQPADAQCPLSVIGVDLTMDNLSDALLKLQALGLSSICLANLSSLHHCTQLRHLYCEFVRRPHHPELLNM